MYNIIVVYTFLILLSFDVNKHELQHFVTVLVVGTLEPIPVSHFKAHVSKMHANDDYLFSEEYAVS